MPIDKETDLEKEKLPLLLYDGECSLCLAWVRRWKRLTGNRICFQPYQEAGDLAPDTEPSALSGAIHLVVPGIGVFSGVEALVRSLAWARPRCWGWLMACYRYLPGFRFLSERLYRIIARHRNRRSFQES